MIFAGITNPPPAEPTLPQPPVDAVELAADSPPEMKPAATKRSPRRRRGRNAEGRFQADDPATPDQDEAWTEG